VGEVTRLETVDGDNWEEFIQHSPAAVLVIGKSDCDSCARWSEDLAAHLEETDLWPQVRFGKVLVDTRGLTDFKRANLWLGDVDELPFNVIYVEGERAKSFAGGGFERLEARLRRVLETESG
jgi:hypothetical protein